MPLPPTRYALRMVRSSFDGSRRRLLAAFAVASLPARVSLAASGVRRIGILWYGRELFEEDAKGFFEELAARGWVRGRNLEVIAPYFDPLKADMPLEKAVAEVVAAGAELVLADGTTVTRAVQRAAPRMALVVTVADPVGSGFAGSIVRPGGSVTGFTQGQTEIASKDVELLRAVLPRLARIAVLFRAQEVSARELASIIEKGVRREGLEARTYVLAGAEDFLPAIRATAAAGDGAAYVGNVGESSAKLIAEAAIAHRLPTITPYPDWVKGGLLLSFRLYEPEQGPRFAAITDKILRGANPADIPFELPRLSELVVNRRTAAAMRLALPQDLLLRADRVIG